MTFTQESFFCQKSSLDVQPKETKNDEILDDTQIYNIPHLYLPTTALIDPIVKSHRCHL